MVVFSIKPFIFQGMVGLKWIFLWLLLINTFAYAKEGDFGKSVRHYRENNLDSALHTIDKAIDLYTRQGNNDSLVFAITHKALIYASKFGLQDARQLMDKAMGLVSKLQGNSVARVAAYTRIGQLGVQMYHLEEARQYFKKAEKAIDQHQPANRNYVILYHATGQLYLSAQQYQLAHDYAQKAYEMNLQVEGADGALMANIWQTRYYINYFRGDYNQALQDGLEFRRVLEMHYPPDHPNSGMMHNSLSEVYHALNLPEKALYHQHQAVDIHYGNYLETGNGYNLAGAYSNLGGLYYALHEYYLANEYLTKAQQLFEAVFGEFGPGMLETLVMLGSTKQKLGLATAAEALFERAYRLQQAHVPDETAKKAYIESYYADFQFSQDRFAAAIDYYDRAIINYRRIGAGNSYYSLHARADKGATLGYLDRWDEAIGIQRAAWDDFCRHFPQLTNRTLSFLDNISTTYRHAGRFKQAMAYSDSVLLRSLQMEQPPADPSAWIPDMPYSFNSCIFLLNRVSILHGTYKQTRQQQHLIAILSIIDGYSAFVAANLYTFRSQASLIEQADMNKKLFSIGIESCWALSGEGKDTHYLEKALDYAERSKALLLRLASNNLMVDASRGADDAVAARDHGFRTRINSLNEQYLNTTTGSDSLLRILTMTMEGYRSFQDSLRQSGHASFLAKYDLRPYSLAEIRAKLLANRETLIHYAVTDESVYAFVVTANVFRVHRMEKDALRTINDLQHLHALSAQRFATLAYQLYRVLVQPLAPYFDSGRLLVIPDAELYYLNFELLIQHDGERHFGRMPYLIRQYTFSYLLSASSAIHFKEARSHPARSRAVLFVPVFTEEMKAALRESLPAHTDENDTYFFLSRQPFSLQAAKRIGRFISHDMFTGQQAQEHIFKRTAKDYRILHFGTHAEVNNLSPLQSRLFFARSLPNDTSNTDDGYLYASEIYTMQLRAELAVLIACETGTGALRNGEGVVSLAHSFLHAGCSAVVMALWKIDEKTNAGIVSGFYEYLSKGMDKSEALRHAKLHFIETSDEELSHPYYWAGLALIGDGAPLYKSYTLLYWGIGLCVLLLSGLLFANRKKYF